MSKMRATGNRAWPTVLIAVFAVVVLLVVVVGDRSGWLKLRPASGTANAMALAATPTGNGS